MRKTGTYKVITTNEEKVSAFIPYNLPPSPPLEMSSEILELLEEAKTNCRLLNLSSEMVPDKNWFIYGFVRKEAVLSSQIEGTQATLLDVFESEANLQSETPDLEEITNYIKALNYCLRELENPEGLPLSLRLLKNAHEILMSGVRGQNKSPGEFRKSQNWIGGKRPSKATFVPPPVDDMKECLSNFEKYLHGKDAIDPIIKIALLHLQFETIHPFLDGNGRIGRLLITLLFAEWKILNQPLLYLSLYFKLNRQEYYQKLTDVRLKGDFEGWVEFFLEGVNEMALEAIDTARDLFNIVKEANLLVLNSENSNFGAVRLITFLPSKPIFSVNDVVQLLEITKPTAQKTIDALLSLKIIVETTGKERGKRYSFMRYVERICEGTGL